MANSAFSVGNFSIGSAITSGTSGSVLFVNSSGQLAQDNPNFFWDDTNNRLGIGTASPGYALEINVAGTATTITSSQFVPLLGNGNIQAMYFGRSSGTNLSGTLEYTYNSGVLASSYTSLGVWGSAQTLNVTGGGNVGIGTTAPGALLTAFYSSGTPAAGNQIRFSWGAGTQPNVQSLAFGGDNTQGPYLASHTDGADASLYNAIAIKQLFGANGFIVQTSPATAAGGARTFTSRFIVDPTGNVGIGTASPVTNLHVYGADSGSHSSTNRGQLAVYTSNAQAADIGGQISLGGRYSITDATPISYGFITGAKESGANDNVDGYLALGTSLNSTSPYSFERMRITSLGNVGIGTTVPNEKLDIGSTVGDSFTGSPNIQFSYTPSPTAYKNSIQNLFSGDNTLHTMKFTLTSNSVLVTPLYLLGTGNVGVNNALPLARLDILNNKASAVVAGSTNTTLNIQETVAGITSAIRFGGVAANGAVGNMGMIMWSAGADGTVADNKLSFAAESQSTLREDLVILGSGNVGIGTTAPDKALEINSATGANLRLTYNDSNGGAANYADFDMSSGGNLQITPTGLFTTMIGLTTMNRNGVNGAGVAGVTIVSTDAKTVGDAIGLSFNALNSSSAAKTYTQFYTEIIDPTAGSEDGDFYISPIRAGALVEALRIKSTGNVVLTGAYVGSTQALSGAGAANVTTETTKITSTGVLDAISLADGVNGQTKIILHDVDGGSFVLTPTTKTGWTTFTSTAAGESIMLKFVTTRGWIVIGSYLGVIA